MTRKVSAFETALSIGAFFMLGCASSQHVHPVDTPLGRAIRYTERTSRGERIPISESTGPILHVPSGAEVDVNSAIEIEVDTATIVVPGTYTPDRSAAILGEVKAKKLRDLMVAVNGVITARSKAVAAYQKVKALSPQEAENSPAMDEFDDTVRQFGIAKDSFTQLPIWTDGTFTLAEKNEAFRDRTLQKVGTLIQRELDKAESSLRKQSDQLMANAATLRMQAFLQTPKGENSPIHLDGYDTYDQLAVKLKDPSVIDADDWKVFEAQYNQVVDLAKQAEKVRTGELSLDRALYTSGSAAVTQLMDRVEAFKPLFEKDWKKELNQLSPELRSLSDETTSILEKRGKQELAMWRESATAVSTLALTELPIDQFKSVTGEITSLRDDWRSVTPDTFIAAYQRSQLLPIKISELETAAEGVHLDKTREALDTLRARLERRPEELSGEEWAEVQAAIQRSPIYAQVKELSGYVDMAAAFIHDAPHLLDFKKVDPSATDLRPPQVREVALPDVRGTRVEVSRTSRVVGDRILVSAALGAAGWNPISSNALFVVREFGWHTVMAPSVILSRPFTSHSAFDRDFKFSPAVAWLKRYYPRDMETGWWNAVARFLQPGFGVHAAFLDHTPDKDTEVGVGAAVSFVEDLVVAGAGVNLMNNSKGYFYVGSNLIPILQKLGFAKEGGAGKKP